jgi:anti-sigma factor ChrR (cupin superfamily)
VLSCREIVQDADRLLAAELPWRRRVAVKLHLLMCRHCRRYVRQLRALIHAVPFMHSKASDEEVTKIMDHVCPSEPRRP